MAKKQKNKEKPVATIDAETDPFLYGRVPKPFVWGFYSNDIGYKYFWGHDCTLQLLSFLASLETPHVIYAHNGGKFDFFFFIKELSNPIKIINGRIVKASLGVHELRDSYSALPIPLAKINKDEINYEMFEEWAREDHKDEIVSYLKTDCFELFKAIVKFRFRHGDKLTIGGASMAALQKLHPFSKGNKTHDERFRPFYFGGRVEFFERGIIKGKWKVFDVNSMYPWVMKTFHHPEGQNYQYVENPRLSDLLRLKVFFCTVRCMNYGAFPTRIKNQPLDFSIESGIFNVTSHELIAALECKRISSLEILSAWIPSRTIQFAEYVDGRIIEKIEYGKAGDKANREIIKLEMNSPYGKFGQNPEYYKEYHIGEPEENDGWSIYMTGDEGFQIWDKPSESESYYDVAIAASITGASRATLMRALTKARRPIYCDTDSIICEDLPGVELDEDALGAWKYEGEGDEIAIAGKKLYTLTKKGKVIKLASKGAVLTANEIKQVCRGNSVEWKNQAPSFSLSKPVGFTNRKIQLVKPK